MSLPMSFNALTTIQRQLHADVILEANQESTAYGLILTPTEAEEIAEARTLTLRNLGRVETSFDTSLKLITAFCTSPFIDQDSYAETLKDLHEIFYYVKNETEDQIGDEALIELLLDLFNNECEGSLELLEGSAIDSFIRKRKRESLKNSNLYNEEVSL